MRGRHLYILPPLLNEPQHATAYNCCSRLFPLVSPSSLKTVHRPSLTQKFAHCCCHSWVISFLATARKYFLKWRREGSFWSPSCTSLTCHTLTNDICQELLSNLIPLDYILLCQVKVHFIQVIPIHEMLSPDLLTERIIIPQNEKEFFCYR